MRFWVFLLLPFCLFATVSEPLRCILISGYRNDRLHWHLQEPGEGTLTYSELYRDVQFWENGLILKVIHRDFVFFVRGSYSAFGRGTLFQKYADLSFTSEEPEFQFNTHGWGADAYGYFGYAANLTPDRTYRVLVIPLIGYRGRFEWLDRREAAPNPLVSDNAVGAASFSMQSSLPHKLHQTWNGVFLGGALQMEPRERLAFQVGYAYHWLHFRFKTYRSLQTDLLNAGSELISSQTTTTRVKASAGGNLGHAGWAEMDILLTRAWRVGLGANIYYMSTRVIDASLQSETNGMTSANPSQKLKLRWTTVAGWLQVSRSF